VALMGSPPDPGLQCADRRVLAFLRAVVVAVQIAAVLVAVFCLETTLPLLPLVCGIAMVAVADVTTLAKPNVQVELPVFHEVA
jgi:hypothetical protein